MAKSTIGTGGMSSKLHAVALIQGLIPTGIYKNPVTTTLSSDGFYYTNIGYRFHATSLDGIFRQAWDLEVC